ncbi:hypothetical protein B0H11DRAFT_2246449 [Mycena galericulata]|nr:hypothetical protein B0H11DRAFT_2246449 [Mycena galericulata]
MLKSMLDSTALLVRVLQVALSMTPLNDSNVTLGYDPLKPAPLEGTRVETNRVGLRVDAARLLTSSSKIVVAGFEADSGEWQERRGRQRWRK